MENIKAKIAPHLLYKCIKLKTGDTKTAHNKIIKVNHSRCNMHGSI